jgi:hypothetical protein
MAFARITMRGVEARGGGDEAAGAGYTYSSFHARTVSTICSRAASCRRNRSRNRRCRCGTGSNLHEQAPHAHTGVPPPTGTHHGRCPARRWACNAQSMGRGGSPALDVKPCRPTAGAVGSVSVRSASPMWRWLMPTAKCFTGRLNQPATSVVQEEPPPQGQRAELGEEGWGGGEACNPAWTCRVGGGARGGSEAPRASVAVNIEHGHPATQQPLAAQGPGQ